MFHPKDKNEKGVEYYIVEGNIGSGKSTFLKMVKENYDVTVVYEPLEAWQKVGSSGNLLEKFYNDTNRWAYTFQTYAFLSRLEKQQELFNAQGVNLVERSVYSDRYCFAQNCFEMGLMMQIEWELYKKWFEWLVDEHTTPPTGIIYLRTNPEISFERLKKRHRAEEDVVALSYLMKLHEKHEDWLIHKKGIRPALQEVPVLVLECDEDFESNPHVFAMIKEKIAQFMKINSLK